MKEQKKRCEEWKGGGFISMMSKYKPSDDKFRPVNEVMHQYINPPLHRNAFSRDLYENTLAMKPTESEDTACVTKDRLELVKFGPGGWLGEETKKSNLRVIVLRENEVVFDKSERGCLKYKRGFPHFIPVIEHKPWQKRKINIPKAITEEHVELVRERMSPGVYEKSTSYYFSPVLCVLNENGKLCVGHDLK